MYIYGEYLAVGWVSKPQGRSTQASSCIGTPQKRVSKLDVTFTVLMYSVSAPLPLQPGEGTGWTSCLRLRSIGPTMPPGSTMMYLITSEKSVPGGEA